MGPPNWTWYSLKTAPLKYLQENRPASGLTITEEALEKFKQKCLDEENKERIIREYKDAKARLEGKPTQSEKDARRKEKEAKRAASGKNIPKRKRQAIGGNHDKHEYEVKYIKYQPPVSPSTLCIFCLQPVYFYERMDPPTCLWCEKTIADEQGE